MSLSKESQVSVNQVVSLLDLPAEEVVMGIQVEGMSHILDRLTDLYSDPAAATVRETISNGIDATAMLPLDQQRPVEITSPTALSPHLIIQDHGIGMSPDTVRNIYSQYGASTKRNDFSQIGAFGLGAKAPLAYCSEYSVETVNEGTKTVFTVSRTPKGNFTKILSIEPTKDESGTTLTIPVVPSDWPQFESALASYKNFSFDVPISVNGEIFEASKYILLADNFLLDEASNTQSRIWLRRDSFYEYIEAASKNSYLVPTYVLSGWAYYSERAYRNADPVIVELKPGIVDFSSSRDEITRNERLTKLDERVKKFISGDKKALARAWEIYGELDPKSSFQFFQKIFHSYSSYSNLEMFTLGQKDYPLAQLTTNDGFNPMELVSEKRKKNVYGIIGFNRNDFTTIRSIAELRKTYRYHEKDGKASLAAHATAVSQGAKISEINAFIREAVEAKKPQENLARIAALRIAQGGSYYSRSMSDLQVHLIEGSTKDNIGKLLAERSILADKNSYNLIWAFVTDGAAVKADMEILESCMGVSFTISKADDLITKAKELRKEQRGSSNSLIATVEKMKLIQIAEKASVVEGELKLALDRPRGYYHPNQVDISVADLKAQDAILLLIHDDHSPLILMGAANAGHRVEGRPIYTTLASKGARYEHLKELDGYDGLFVGRSYKPSSKIAEKVAAERTYDAQYLHAKLDLAEEFDVVGAYLYRQGWSVEASEAYANYLKKGKNSEWVSILESLPKANKAYNKAYATRSGYGRHYSYETYDLEDIAYKVGKSKAQKVGILAKVFKEVSKGATSDARIFAILVDRQASISPSPLSDAVFEYFHNLVIAEAATA